MNAPRVLIAGIGNVFLGDDGFGVEVLRRLGGRPLADGVSLKDFGVRGLDFAYALLDGYDVAILVDAMPRGRSPGTLTVLEPEDVGDVDPRHLEISTHGMNPVRALGFARAMGAKPGCVRVVGCEPAFLGDLDEPAVGLSEAVLAAVDPAIEIIERLVTELLLEIPAPRRQGGDA